MEYIGHYDSPLGGITLASDGEALVGLWFDGQEHFMEGLGEVQEAENLPVFKVTARWLDCYFSGDKPNFLPPLRFRGTPFRRTVWGALMDVPYGQTVTYRQLADALVERGVTATSPRAVGGAVAHNPISLIVPCHRVMGSDGSLTGYAGGMVRKRRLLDLEQGRPLK